MIKAIIFTTFWMFVIPIILGLGILKLDKKGNKNVCLALVLGLFVELLLFEILSIPMTFLKCTFTLLKNSWAVGIIILTAISIGINIKTFKEIAVQNYEEFKKLPKILTVIFLVLLLIQCYVPFKYMHEDYDDSNFVAKATIAIDTNSLFVYDDAGNEYKEFPTRTVLSQFPHYTAVIGELSGTHPTIVAHTIFPVIFVVIAYAFYYVLGMTLFKKDQTKTLVFLNILAVIFIYGDYSRYTNFVRLLYRVWQGKSILANVTLPFIWYVFMEYIGKENSIFGWIILFIALGGSIALSSMALVLPVITTLILMVIYAIKDKKIIYIVSILICCIPCVIVGVVYLKMDNPIVKSSAINNDELSIEEKITAVFETADEEKNINTVEQSFERAGGTTYYISIFTVAMFFIWATCKKDRPDVVAVFTVFSAIVFVINFNNIFANAWNMILGSGVHWRVYWLLPIGYAIAFMFTEIVFMADGMLSKIIAMLLCIGVIMFNGSNVYREGNFAKTDNYFKIPDLALEMIFKVSEDNNDYKKIAGPIEFSVYTRQVDGNILLAQIRNVNNIYSNTSLLKLATDGDSEKIYEQAIKQKCNYIVMIKTSINEEDPLTNYGFNIMHENDKYVLYKIDLEEKVGM